jgi:hypothetical protein
MWSRKYSKCINCGKTETKHVAKGLCRKCYTLNTEDKHKKHQRYKRGVVEEFLTKNKLIELYIDEGMSLTDIGKIAGCTRVNVHYKLKRYGIEARSKTAARTMALDKGKIKTTKADEYGNEEEIIFQKIRYNKYFFKTWSAEMAYVLGLIYTDGNLHIRKDKSGYELGILSFAQKDKELVEKTIKLMDCNAKIRFKSRQELKNTIAGELYYFSIGNNDLANDLIKLGLTPKKSLDMQFPEIPDEFLRHFVRGLFDGDGTVYLDKLTVRVKLQSGSNLFIQTLNTLMANNDFPSRTIDISYREKNGVKFPVSHVICYSAKSIVKHFFEFIYHDVPPKMYYSRKYQIFKDNWDKLKYK